VIGTETHHEHLVDAEGGNGGEPVDVGLEQRLAVGHDGVVHRVPVTAELCGHLVHAAGPSSDLFGRPTCRPSGERLTGTGDLIVGLGPGAHVAVRVRASPPAFVPHQPGYPSLEREVDELDGGPVLHLGHAAAAGTAAAVGRRLHVDPRLATGSVFTAEEPDTTKSDHPVQRARRVGLHGGPPSQVVEQPQIGGPPLRARGSRWCGPTPLISEVPAKLRPTKSADSVTAATKASLSSLAHRIQALDAEITELDEKIESLLLATAPDLMARFGVGPDSAASLLVAAGDNPERLHSEAAWAHLCGVSPVPADSGKNAGHLRRHSGGNRQANSALWRIAMVRIAHDPETRAYFERRMKEGRTKRDIIRILQRYIAREVYRFLPRG
jgi:hypothetical protein